MPKSPILGGVLWLFGLVACAAQLVSAEEAPFRPTPGQLPPLAEAKAFQADKEPAKRDKLIAKLLASGDYADNFANKWGALLRN